MFSYGDNTKDIRKILETLKSIVDGKSNRIIHFINLGNSNFIRFSDDRWHAYKLEKKAPGYFIHNIIEWICPLSVGDYKDLWFPKEGKNINKIGEISFRDN